MLKQLTYHADVCLRNDNNNKDQGNLVKDEIVLVCISHVAA